MTGAQEQNNRRGGDRENQDYQESGSCQLQAKVPVERYRRIHVILASTMTHQDAERIKRSGEKYPCAVTSEKWRQMYKEKEDAKEREDEKRIKREEREKKRTLNEELKMKRMQERSDKQKKDE